MAEHQLGVTEVFHTEPTQKRENMTAQEEQ